MGIRTIQDPLPTVEGYIDFGQHGVLPAEAQRILREAVRKGQGMDGDYRRRLELQKAIDRVKRKFAEFFKSED